VQHLWRFTLLLALVTGCGGDPEPLSPGAPSSTEGGDEGGDTFELRASDTAEQARGERPSQIRATRTMAAMRLFIVDPETGPIEGIVVKLTAPDGSAYYTAESDGAGYAEVLVPVGRRYDIEYLSLGRRRISAHVDVPEGPNQDIRLTMRYRRLRQTPAPAAPGESPAPGLVLQGVLFESGSAVLDPSSFERLDRVVEYLTYRMSARLRIEGHTDSVGDPARNRRLSEQRAEAVRRYLLDHGIDGDRVEAVGLGDQRPVAPNDTEEGRARNRRIEAIEL
jgi:outer membrane protein OmpA-like peptidoglycan-associated protein